MAGIGFPEWLALIAIVLMVWGARDPKIREDFSEALRNFFRGPRPPAV